MKILITYINDNNEIAESSECTSFDEFQEQLPDLIREVKALARGIDK